MGNTVKLVLEALREAPEACQVALSAALPLELEAVLLRQGPDELACWPVPVLAPCLVALVKEDLPEWRAWRAGPFDRSLLAATWDASSELCKHKAFEHILLRGSCMCTCKIV